MARRFTLAEEAYTSMLEYMNCLAETDRAGLEKDTAFIRDDFWLQDTAVIENIELRHGEWCIYLVFAHHLKPLKFIKRRIVQYACPKKASVAAHYMRRQAAKDQRGTLSVKKDLINLIFN